MSQEPRDVIRSIHYHVAQHVKAYDAEFDIRLAIEEDAWERPAAIVQTAGPAVLSNQGRRIAETIRPFVVYLYPKAGATPKLAELEAQRLEGALAKIFQVGGFGGHPARIPLFDWSEIADGEGLPDGTEHVAWLKVKDATVDHKPDPDDETLQTVYANLRVSWRGVGEPMPSGPTLESITTTPQNPA